MTKSKLALVATALVATLAAGTTTALAAQPPAAAPAPKSVIARFTVGESGFLTVRLTKAADIATVRAGNPTRMHPIGTIVWGVTDVNEGHPWHLKDVELTDMSTEYCDGQLDDVVKGKWNVGGGGGGGGGLDSVR